jgi:hypothetical protein
MNRQDWERSKKQMKKLLEQGIAELKELAAETSYMTDATAKVVKTELDVHRLRNRLEKVQTRLGREVVRAASSNGAIKPTNQIKKLIQEIRSLEGKIDADEKQIKKIPLSWSAAKQAVAKRAKTASTRRSKAARAKQSSI